MKKWLGVCLIAFICIRAEAQTNYKQVVDSLVYINNVPYIHDSDPVYWNIVQHGLHVVPLLIENLSDTTELSDLYVRFWGGTYTVADLSFSLLEDIIEIPTFEFLNQEELAGCGYCNYWNYVREDYDNRVKFQQKIKQWYEQWQNNLVWQDDPTLLISERTNPAGGYYKVVIESCFKNK